KISFIDVSTQAVASPAGTSANVEINGVLYKYTADNGIDAKLGYALYGASYTNVAMTPEGLLTDHNNDDVPDIYKKIVYGDYSDARTLDNADTDADGIPDAVEIKVWGAKSVVSNSMADSDNDGLADIIEYIALGGLSSSGVSSVAALTELGLTLGTTTYAVRHNRDLTFTFINTDTGEQSTSNRFGEVVIQSKVYKTQVALDGTVELLEKSMVLLNKTYKIEIVGSAYRFTATDTGKQYTSYVKDNMDVVMIDGYIFRVTRDNQNSIVLTQIPKPDINGDGKVDPDDLAAINNAISVQKEADRADIVGLGVINFDDYRTLKQIVAIRSDSTMTVDLENKAKLQTMATLSYNTYLQNKAMEYDVRKMHSGDTLSRVTGMYSAAAGQAGVIDNTDVEEFEKALAVKDSLYDFTQDGIIDERDATWLENMVKVLDVYNKYASNTAIRNPLKFIQDAWLSADVNGDGMVNQDDIDLISFSYQNYGNARFDVAGDNGVVNNADIELTWNKIKTLWPGAYEYDGVHAPMSLWPDGQGDGSRKGESVLFGRKYAQSLTYSDFTPNADRKTLSSVTTSTTSQSPSITYTADVDETGAYYVGLSARVLPGLEVPKDFKYSVWVYVDGAYFGSLSVDAITGRYAESSIRLNLTKGTGHNIKFEFKNIGPARGIEVKELYLNRSGFSLEKFDVDNDGAVTNADWEGLVDDITTSYNADNNECTDNGDITYVKNIMTQYGSIVRAGTTGYVARADVNKDGKIDETDVLLLEKFIDANDNNNDGKVSAVGDNNDIDRLKDIARFYIAQKAYTVVNGHYLMDFNGDGYINTLDLSYFTDALSVVDLNGNGTIDKVGTGTTLSDKDILQTIIDLNQVRISAGDLERLDVTHNATYTVSDGTDAGNTSLGSEITLNGRKFILRRNAETGRYTLVETAQQSQVVLGKGIVINGRQYTIQEDGNTFVVVDGQTRIPADQKGRVSVDGKPYQISKDAVTGNILVSLISAQLFAQSVATIKVGDRTYDVRVDAGTKRFIFSDGLTQISSAPVNAATHEITIGGLSYTLDVAAYNASGSVHLSRSPQEAAIQNMVTVGRYTYSCDVEGGTLNFTRNGVLYRTIATGTDPHSDKYIVLNGIAYKIWWHDATPAWKMTEEIAGLNESGDVFAIQINGVTRTFLTRKNSDNTYILYDTVTDTSYVSDVRGDTVTIDGYIYKILSDNGRIQLSKQNETITRSVDQVIEVVIQAQLMRERGIQYAVTYDANKGVHVFSDGVNQYYGTIVTSGIYTTERVTLSGYSFTVGVYTTGLETNLTKLDLIQPEGQPLPPGFTVTGKVASWGRMTIHGVTYDILKDADGDYSLVHGRQVIELGKSGTDIKLDQLDGRTYTIVDDSEHKLSKLQLVIGAADRKAMQVVAIGSTSYYVRDDGMLYTAKTGNEAYVPVDEALLATVPGGYTKVLLGDGSERGMYVCDASLPIGFISEAEGTIMIGSRKYEVAKAAGNTFNLLLNGYVYKDTISAGNTLTIEGTTYTVGASQNGLLRLSEVSPTVSVKAQDGSYTVLNNKLYEITREESRIEQLLGALPADYHNGDYVITDGTGVYKTYRGKVIISDDDAFSLDGTPTFAGTSIDNYTVIDGITYAVRKVADSDKFILEQVGAESTVVEPGNVISMNGVEYEYTYDPKRGTAGRYVFTDTLSKLAYESLDNLKEVKLADNIGYRIIRNADTGSVSLEKIYNPTALVGAGHEISVEGKTYEIQRRGLDTYTFVRTIDGVLDSSDSPRSYLEPVTKKHIIVINHKVYDVKGTELENGDEEVQLTERNQYVSTVPNTSSQRSVSIDGVEYYIAAYTPNNSYTFVTKDGTKTYYADRNTFESTGLTSGDGAVGAIDIGYDTYRVERSGEHYSFISPLGVTCVPDNHGLVTIGTETYTVIEGPTTIKLQAVTSYVRIGEELYSINETNNKLYLNKNFTSLSKEAAISLAGTIYTVEYDPVFGNYALYDGYNRYTTSSDRAEILIGTKTYTVTRDVMTNAIRLDEKNPGIIDYYSQFGRRFITLEDGKEYTVSDLADGRVSLASIDKTYVSNAACRIDVNGTIYTVSAGPNNELKLTRLVRSEMAKGDIVCINNRYYAIAYNSDAVVDNDDLTAILASYTTFSQLDLNADGKLDQGDINVKIQDIESARKKIEALKDKIDTIQNTLSSMYYKEQYAPEAIKSALTNTQAQFDYYIALYRAMNLGGTDRYVFKVKNNDKLTLDGIEYTVTNNGTVWTMTHGTTAVTVNTDNAGQLANVLFPTTPVAYTAHLETDANGNKLVLERKRVFTAAVKPVVPPQGSQAVPVVMTIHGKQYNVTCLETKSVENRVPLFGIYKFVPIDNEGNPDTARASTSTLGGTVQKVWIDGFKFYINDRASGLVLTELTAPYGDASVVTLAGKPTQTVAQSTKIVRLDTGDYHVGVLEPTSATAPSYEITPSDITADVARIVLGNSIYKINVNAADGKWIFQKDGINEFTLTMGDNNTLRQIGTATYAITTWVDTALTKHLGLTVVSDSVKLGGVQYDITYDRTAKTWSFRRGEVIESVIGVADNNTMRQIGRTPYKIFTDGTHLSLAGVTYEFKDNDGTVYTSVISSDTNENILTVNDKQYLVSDGPSTVMDETSYAIPAVSAGSFTSGATIGNISFAVSYDDASGVWTLTTDQGEDWTVAKTDTTVTVNGTDYTVYVSGNNLTLTEIKDEILIDGINYSTRLDLATNTWTVREREEVSVQGTVKNIRINGKVYDAAYNGANNTWNLVRRDDPAISYTVQGAVGADQHDNNTDKMIDSKLYHVVIQDGTLTLVRVRDYAVTASNQRITFDNNKVYVAAIRERATGLTTTVKTLTLTEDCLDIIQMGVVDKNVYLTPASMKNIARRALYEIQADIAGPTGDLNPDGKVDANDVIAFNKNPIDLNGDNAIDGQDTNLLWSIITGDQNLLYAYDFNANDRIDNGDIEALQTLINANTGVDLDLNSDGKADAGDVEYLKQVVAVENVRRMLKESIDQNSNGRVEAAEYDLFKAVLDNTSDLTGDGFINVDDGAAFSSVKAFVNTVGAGKIAVYDLNNDGIVDYKDRKIYADSLAGYKDVDGNNNVNVYDESILHAITSGGGTLPDGRRIIDLPQYYLPKSMVLKADMNADLAITAADFSTWSGFKPDQMITKRIVPAGTAGNLHGFTSHAGVPGAGTQPLSTNKTKGDFTFDVLLANDVDGIYSFMLTAKSSKPTVLKFNVYIDDKFAGSFTEGASNTVASEAGLKLDLAGDGKQHAIRFEMENLSSIDSSVTIEKFVLTEPVPSQYDINNDGEVTTEDGVLINRIIEAQRILDMCDVNFDHKVDIDDLNMLDPSGPDANGNRTITQAEAALRPDAYGRVTQTETRRDIDGCGKVSNADLALLLDVVNTINDIRYADINEDGIIDAKDYSALANGRLVISRMQTAAQNNGIDFSTVSLADMQSVEDKMRTLPLAQVMASDLNHDSTVDESDLALIREYIANGKMNDILNALSLMPATGITIGTNVFTQEDIVRALLELKNFNTIGGKLGVSTVNEYTFDAVDNAWSQKTGDWNVNNSRYASQATYDLDSEKDGIPDRLDTDSDNDGFSDGYEYANGFDWRNPLEHPQGTSSDTDGDGVSSAAESSDSWQKEALEALAKANPSLAVEIRSIPLDQCSQPGDLARFVVNIVREKVYTGEFIDGIGTMSLAISATDTPWSDLNNELKAALMTFLSAANDDKLNAIRDMDLTTTLTADSLSVIAGALTRSVVGASTGTGVAAITYNDGTDRLFRAVLKNVFNGKTLPKSLADYYKDAGNDLSAAFMEYSLDLGEVNSTLTGADKTMMETALSAGIQWIQNSHNSDWDGEGGIDELAWYMLYAIITNRMVSSAAIIGALADNAVDLSRDACQDTKVLQTVLAMYTANHSLASVIQGVDITNLTNARFLNLVNTMIGADPRDSALLGVTLGRSIDMNSFKSADALKTALLADALHYENGLTDAINGVSTAGGTKAFTDALFHKLLIKDSSLTESLITGRTTDVDHDGIIDSGDADSDNDGFSDGEEVGNGTNPFDKDSRPAATSSDADGDGLNDDKEAPLSISLDDDMSNVSDLAMSAEVRFTKDDPGAAGIIIRAIQPQGRFVAPLNYYDVTVDMQAGKLEFRKVSMGVPVIIAQSNLPERMLYEWNAWHTIGIKAEGADFTIFLDGQAQFTAHDESLQSGAVGIYSAPDTSSEFDTIRCEAITPITDVIAKRLLDTDLNNDGSVDENDYYLLSAINAYGDILSNHGRSKALVADIAKADFTNDGIVDINDLYVFDVNGDRDNTQDPNRGINAADIDTVKKAVNLSERLTRRGEFDLNGDGTISIADYNYAEESLRYRPYMDVNNDAAIDWRDGFYIDAVIGMDTAYNPAWELTADVNGDHFVDSKDVDDLKFALANYLNADIDGDGQRNKLLDLQALEAMILNIGLAYEGPVLTYANRDAVVIPDDFDKTDVDGGGTITSDDIAAIDKWVTFADGIRSRMAAVPPTATQADLDTAYQMMGTMKNHPAYVKYDLTMDGTVDGRDLVLAQNIFNRVKDGRYLTKADYNRYNFDKRGVIDNDDVTALGKVFDWYVDVDGRPGVGAGDVQAIEQVFKMRANGITEDMIKRADINGDGFINKTDKQLIDNCLGVLEVIGRRNNGDVTPDGEADYFALMDEYISGKIPGRNEILASDENGDGQVDLNDIDVLTAEIDGLNAQIETANAWIEKAPLAFDEVMKNVADVDGDGIITLTSTSTKVSDVDQLREIVSNRADRVSKPYITADVIKKADFDQNGRVDDADMALLDIHFDSNALRMLDLNADGRITGSDRAEFLTVKHALDTDQILDFKIYRKFDLNADGKLDNKDGRYIEAIAKGYIDVDGDYVANDNGEADGGVSDMGLVADLAAMQTFVDRMNALTNASDPLSVQQIISQDELWANKTRGIDRYLKADFDTTDGKGVINMRDVQALRLAMDVRDNTYYDLDSNGVFDRQDVLLIDELAKSIATYAVYEQANMFDETQSFTGATVLNPYEFDIRDISNDQRIDATDLAIVREARQDMMSFRQDGLVRFIDSIMIEKYKNLNVSIKREDIAKANFVTQNDVGNKPTIGDMLPYNPFPKNIFESYQRKIHMPEGEETVINDIIVAGKNLPKPPPEGYLNIFGSVQTYIPGADMSKPGADINGDGLVNGQDLFYVQNAMNELASGENLKIYEKGMGDIDKDGRLTVKDYDILSRVQKYATDVNRDGSIDHQDKEGMYDILDRIMLAKDVRKQIDTLNTVKTEAHAEFDAKFAALSPAQQFNLHNVKVPTFTSTEQADAENYINNIETLARQVGYSMGADNVQLGYEQKLAEIKNVLTDKIFTNFEDVFANTVNPTPEERAQQTAFQNALRTLTTELKVKPEITPSYTGYENIDTQSLRDELSTIFSPAQLDINSDGTIGRDEVLQVLQGVFNFTGLDKDGNGSIDDSELADTKKMMQSVLKASALSQEDLNRADISGDGIVNGFDADLAYKAATSAIDTDHNYRIDNQDYRSWLMLYDYLGYGVAAGEFTAFDFDGDSYVEAGQDLSLAASSPTTEYFFDLNHNGHYDAGEPFYDAIQPGETKPNGKFDGNTTSPAGYVFNEYAQTHPQYAALAGDLLAGQDIVEKAGQDALNFDGDGKFTKTDARAVADMIDLITSGTVVADMQKFFAADLATTVDLTQYVTWTDPITQEGITDFAVSGKDGVVNARDIALFDQIYRLKQDGILDTDGDGTISRARDPARINEIADFDTLSDKFAKWNEEVLANPNIDAEHKADYLIDTAKTSNLITIDGFEYTVTRNPLDNHYVFTPFHRNLTTGTTVPTDTIYASDSRNKVTLPSNDPDNPAATKTWTITEDQYARVILSSGTDVIRQKSVVLAYMKAADIETVHGQTEVNYYDKVDLLDKMGIAKGLGISKVDQDFVDMVKEVYNLINGWKVVLEKVAWNEATEYDQVLDVGRQVGVKLQIDGDTQAVTGYSFRALDDPSVVYYTPRTTLKVKIGSVWYQIIPNTENKDIMLKKLYVESQVVAIGGVEITAQIGQTGQYTTKAFLVNTTADGTAYELKSADGKDVYRSQLIDGKNIVLINGVMWRIDRAGSNNAVILTKVSVNQSVYVDLNAREMVELETTPGNHKAYMVGYDTAAKQVVVTNGINTYKTIEGSNVIVIDGKIYEAGYAVTSSQPVPHSFTFAEKPVGDQNGDGIVTAEDIVILTAAMTGTSGVVQGTFTASQDSVHMITIDGKQFDVIMNDDGSMSLSERVDASQYVETIAIGTHVYLVSYENVGMNDSPAFTRYAFVFREFIGLGYQNGDPLPIIAASVYSTTALPPCDLVTIGSATYIVKKEQVAGNNVRIGLYTDLGGGNLALASSDAPYQVVDIKGTGNITKGQRISSVWIGGAYSTIKVRGREFNIQSAGAQYIFKPTTPDPDYNAILNQRGLIDPSDAAYQEALAILKQSYEDAHYITSDIYGRTITIDGITYAIDAAVNGCPGEIRLTGRDESLPANDSIGYTPEKVVIDNANGKLYLDGVEYIKDADDTVVFMFDVGGVTVPVRYRIDSTDPARIRLLEIGDDVEAIDIGTGLGQVQGVIELSGINYTWKTAGSQYIFSNGTGVYTSNADGTTVRIGEYVPANVDISGMTPGQIDAIKGTLFDITVDDFGVVLKVHKEAITRSQVLILGGKTYCITDQEDGSRLMASYPDGIVVGTIQASYTTIMIAGTTYDLDQTGGIITISNGAVQSRQAYLVKAGTGTGKVYTVTTIPGKPGLYRFVTYGEDVESALDPLDGNKNKITLRDPTGRMTAYVINVAAGGVPELTEDFVNRNTQIGRSITIGGSGIIYAVATGSMTSASGTVNLTYQHKGKSYAISFAKNTTYVNLTLFDVDQMTYNADHHVYTFKDNNNVTITTYWDGAVHKAVIGDIEYTVNAADVSLDTETGAATGLLHLQREYRVVYTPQGTGQTSDTLSLIDRYGTKDQPNFDLHAGMRNSITINNTAYSVRAILNGFNQMVYEFGWLDPLTNTIETIPSEINDDGVNEITLLDGKKYLVTQNSGDTMHVEQVEYLTSETVTTFASTDSPAARIVSINGVEYEMTYETVDGLPKFRLYREGVTYDNRNVPNGITVGEGDDATYYSFDENRFIVDLPEMSLGVEGYPDDVYCQALEVYNNQTGETKVFYIKEVMDSVGAEFNYQFYAEGEFYTSYVNKTGQTETEWIDAEGNPSGTFYDTVQGARNVYVTMGNDVIDLRLYDFKLQEKLSKSEVEMRSKYLKYHEFTSLMVDRVGINGANLVSDTSVTGKYSLKLINHLSLPTTVKQKVRFQTMTDDWKNNTQTLDGNTVFQKLDIDNKRFDIITTPTGIMIAEEHLESKDVTTDNVKRIMIGKKLENGDIETAGAYGLTYGMRSDGLLEFTDGLNTFVQDKTTNTVSIYGREFTAYIEGGTDTAGWRVKLVERHAYSIEKATAPGEAFIRMTLIDPDGTTVEYRATKNEGTGLYSFQKYVLAGTPPVLEAAGSPIASYKQARTGDVYYTLGDDGSGNATLKEYAFEATPLDYIALLGEKDLSALIAAYTTRYGLDPYAIDAAEYAGKAPDVFNGLSIYDLVQLYSMQYEANTDLGMSNDWKRNFDRMLFTGRYLDYPYTSNLLSGANVDLSKYVPKALAYYVTPGLETVQEPLENAGTAALISTDREKQYALGDYRRDGISAYGKEFDIVKTSDGTNTLLEKNIYTVGSTSDASFLKYTYKINNVTYTLWSVIDTSYVLDGTVDTKGFKSYIENYVAQLYGKRAGYITVGFDLYSIDQMRSDESIGQDIGYDTVTDEFVMADFGDFG
ncbi:MAG: hypothetical protein PHT32_00175, partial [Candidatus Omnitrophica bacterium]|nr:hypothetical protein [Candidatus Omnitrophota bacterium]